MFYILRLWLENAYSRLHLRVLGGFNRLTPKKEAYEQNPKRQINAGKTSLGAKVVKIGPPARPVRATKRPKKKERSTKKNLTVAIPDCPDHPCPRIQPIFCTRGRLQGVVLNFKLSQHRLNGLRGRKLSFPIALAIGLYKRSSNDKLNCWSGTSATKKTTWRRPDVMHMIGSNEHNVDQV